MNPDVFYDDGGMVRVTRNQVIIGGVVYPLHGITSVRVHLVKANMGCVGVALLLAAALMVVGIFLASKTLVCLITGALTMVAVVVNMVLKSRWKRYQLILVTAGGEQSALESPHEPTIMQPYHAILHALNSRYP